MMATSTAAGSAADLAGDVVIAVSGLCKRYGQLNAVRVIDPQIGHDET
jgi:hypothetical protein